MVEKVEENGGEEEDGDEDEGEEATRSAPTSHQPSRTPFTNLSQVDADLALARTLQEQVRTDTRNAENWLYLNVAGAIQQEEPVQERDEEMADHEVQNHPDFNLQEWCQRFEGEQQRQGAELQIIREEQLRQSQQMRRMIDMLQSLMQHFNIHQAPPPGQQ